MSKPRKKRSSHAAWDRQYAGLGAMPDMPTAPRPPQAGMVWTWNGSELIETRLMKRFGDWRAADTVLSDEVE